MPNKKDSLPKLLTIRQAAEILNVHVETLRRWDTSGKLKAIRVSDRGDRRYDPEAIRAILDSKKTIMTKQSPRCIYCNNQEPDSFKRKAHVLSQFMGNFQPDIYFLGDVVCDNCNEILGKSIEKHFAEKSFEGLIARLHLRRKKDKQSSVILYDSSLLKFHFSSDETITFDPLFLLVKSVLEKIGSTKDPLLLLKKGDLYAFVFAEEVASITSKNEINKLKYKIKPFREGAETAEWVGDRDDSVKIVEAAMTALALKANFSDETVNEESKQIKSSFIAQQNVDIKTARFVAKVVFEYFVYCANASGFLSTIYSEELKPVCDFIKEGTGDAKNFVSVINNNFVSERIKQGNNHYFVAFEVVNGFLIGKVAFMDTIAYQINLGKSPFSLATNTIGNGHAFNLSDKTAKKMRVNKILVLGTHEFSIYNKR
ncbi:MAG: binding domain protein, excisionase family protein [candidate division WWE3 bacterium GW2011_GWA1_43_94]|nr:MAG: binding domain protein, excisionase family protein [candidate division WWE3 bacterium GW2011_GWD2_42_34]KKT26291.1 MAG: binding domain protein, excisionase family protein [candidate division WWE3 bacterium GW2011_GWA1_43_94]HAX65024.1 hypothetical protein [Candidatus Nomurabacteria bacterium]